MSPLWESFDMIGVSLVEYDGNSVNGLGGRLRDHTEQVKTRMPTLTSSLPSDISEHRK